MAAVGPAEYPISSLEQTPVTYTQTITVGAPDTLLSSVYNCGFCRRIFCGAGGIVFVQRANDTVMVGYTLPAGGEIRGQIKAIGGTTNHPTAAAVALNLEL